MVEVGKPVWDDFIKRTDYGYCRCEDEDEINNYVSSIKGLHQFLVRAALVIDDFLCGNVEVYKYDPLLMLYVDPECETEHKWLCVFVLREYEPNVFLNEMDMLDQRLETIGYLDFADYVHFDMRPS